jgi:capsid assembly protease
MIPLRIIEEIYRHRWAMTIPSWRAMLSVIDGEEIKAEDYKYFHSLDTQYKANLAESETFGFRPKDTYYTNIRDNVGFILIDGPIIPRATWFSHMSGMTSLDVATNEFKALEANAKIDTVVHLLDTPGGVATGVSDYAAVIRQSNKKTYTFSWMAASAGMWIGSASNQHIVSEGGEVGSIGVVFTATDYSELDKKRGVKNIEIVSAQSPYKRADPATDEGRAVYQQRANELADVFVNSVASDRNTTPEDVLANYGQGAMVVAKRAKAAGMIDDITDVETFVNSLINKSDVIYNFPNRRVTEESMPKSVNENPNPPVTAESLRSDYPAIVAEIETAAVIKDRNRIKAIEANLDKLKGLHPTARTAAAELVAKRKFDDDATEASVAVELLDVVGKANTQALTEFAAPRREIETNVQKIATATAMPKDEEKDKEKASKERVNNLAAAMQRKVDRKKSNSKRSVH